MRLDINKNEKPKHFKVINMLSAKKEAWVWSRTLRRAFHAKHTSNTSALSGLSYGSLCYLIFIMSNKAVRQH